MDREMLPASAISSICKRMFSKSIDMLSELDIVALTPGVLLLIVITRGLILSPEVKIRELLSPKVSPASKVITASLKSIADASFMTSVNAPLGIVDDIYSLMPSLYIIDTS